MDRPPSGRRRSGASRQRLIAVAVYYRPEALSDVRRVHAFLTPKTPRTADRAVRVIRAAIAKLEQFPRAGRIAPDGHPDHRELLVRFSNGGYVVLYGLDGDELVVINIRHQREGGY
ncbi:MAG: type II toxin-antitoxin system RelE/ParE family toxin [Devosia sp.]